MADSEEWDEQELPQLQAQPADGHAIFRDLPPEMLQKKSYTAWESDLKAHVYRNQKLPVWKSPQLKLASNPGETEAAFRVRLGQRAREERDLRIENCVPSISRNLPPLKTSFYELSRRSNAKSHRSPRKHSQPPFPLAAVFWVPSLVAKQSPRRISVVRAL